MNPVLFSVFIAFAATAVCCPLLIWGLRSLKLTQPILSELPSDHQAKRGTPLMARPLKKSFHTKKVQSFKKIEEAVPFLLYN
ncbi:hypothetical protein PAESOLCIP111_02244 [Paenibacillus solanacearum]|uniref:Uncharacterized protein n=1 Tax=Paenibacillus solanacearum TaxID=2048548 RepID=A0A916JZZ6_9BACL|nr:hypothetical protein [Paenibacillus solanacearum]CAG7620016.1 hypothetical protein PAESOLCIP111_02244 [Paenibacillus solanacearum]